MVPVRAQIAFLKGNGQPLPQISPHSIIILKDAVHLAESLDVREKCKIEGALHIQGTSYIIAP